PEGGLDTRPPAYNMPGIPYHYQITDYNCGPAALQMTMDYCAEEISQSAIADVANTGDPGGTYADDLVRAAHFSGMSAAVQDPLLRGYADRQLGYSAEPYYWGYSASEERYEDLKTLAYSGHPVLILTWFDAGHGSGHFRVVKGYDDNLDVFVVHDPWYYGFSGPDLLVDQTYLVDDLWAYSWWWGMISGPWVLRPEVPSSVAIGDTFSVDLKIRYPGPYPFASNYPCSSCRATVSLSAGLALAAGSSTVNLANLDSGDSAVATWDLVAVGPVGEWGISFQAQGTVNGSCGSYPSYADTIGGHSYETVEVTDGLLAGWQAEERLTAAAGGSQTSWPGSRAMVMDDDGVVHLVWADTRDGNSEIYYRERSAGAWGAEVRLTNDPNFSDGPCVALGPDGWLHVAWVDTRDGNQEIYYKHHDPAGGWSADERVTTYSEGDHSPAIAADAAGVYLAWQQRETGGGLHYYYVMFSMRTVVGWSTPVDVDASPERDSYRPSLACGADGRVHLVYERQTANTPNEKERIVYRNWNGSAWSARTGLSTELAYSRGPAIAAGADGRLHVVWQDGENIGGDIFYIVHDGSAWQAAEEIVTGGGDAATPSVAADGSGTVYVAWADGRHGEPEIYLMGKQGSVWGEQQRLSHGEGESMLPSVAANAYGDPCVVWTDLRHGGSDLYFRATSDVSAVPPSATRFPNGSSFHLGLPYPMPSASGTTVMLAVREASTLAVDVFDVQGNWVRSVASGVYSPGMYNIAWRGDDREGARVASGVYFIRCGAAGRSEVRTVVIVR
ncbi:MAG: C39 family peptidase, partial [bacterium]